MKVLLVEDAPGAGAVAEATLCADGHTVVGCEPADASAPCRGLDLVPACPLDAGDVDVAVVAHTSDGMTPSERGALCSARRRIPVVVAGRPRHAVSFGPGTFVSGDDLARSCRAAAASGAAHEAAIRRSLLINGALQPEDVEADAPQVSFEVRREPRRLRLTVRLEQSDPRQAGIVKAAHEALRAFDQWASVIDVVVVHH